LAPPYTLNPKTLDTPPNTLYAKTTDIPPFYLSLKALTTGCCTLQLDPPKTPQPKPVDAAQNRVRQLAHKYIFKAASLCSKPKFKTHDSSTWLLSQSFGCCSLTSKSLAMFLHVYLTRVPDPVYLTHVPDSSAAQSTRMNQSIEAFTLSSKPGCRVQLKPADSNAWSYRNPQQHTMAPLDIA